MNNQDIRELNELLPVIVALTSLLKKQENVREEARRLLDKKVN